MIVPLDISIPAENEIPNTIKKLIETLDEIIKINENLDEPEEEVKL
jgi:hypothetical protein